MPLQLERYPAVEELGTKGYLEYLSMSAFYVTMIDMFGDEGWVQRLVVMARRESMEADGVLNMKDFIELFNVGAKGFDPELYAVVKEISILHMK